MMMMKHIYLNQSIDSTLALQLQSEYTTNFYFDHHQYYYNFHYQDSLCDVCR